MRDPAEDAALGFDHGETGGVELWKVRGNAVGRHQAFESAIVRFAHRGMDTNLGGHTGDNQLPNATLFQDRAKIRREESSLAGFVDDDFAWYRSEFRYDGMPWFTSHQNSPHGPDVSDANTGLPAHFFRGRKISQIGTMPLASMNNR